MEAYWAYVWKRLSVCGIRLASLYPLIDDILYIPASQASGPAAGAEPTRFQEKKPYDQIIRLGEE